MYRPRLIRWTLQRARDSFPAVLVTGPRQSGKSTLLTQEVTEAHGLISFDDPLQRSFANDDPKGLLAPYADRPLILDEIQYVPGLLPYLKLAIDADRQRKGAFLITGSQQFELMQGVSESLAGRVAILDLLPFSELELPERPLAEAIWTGAYPEPALAPAMRELWLTSYIATYVERDVRQVRDIHDLRTFEQFIALVAARHGQEWRAAPLARACGVSQPTVKSWLSVLAASYVVTLLPPWSANVGKRVVKSPKLYFVDSAIVCHLTRQPGAGAALAGPLAGALFEGWAVLEARKLFAAAGKPPAMWFWRSHDGLEVDLLLDLNGRIVPVEIKLTATPKPGHLHPLQRIAAILGDRVEPGLLVCRVEEETPLPGGAVALPWRSWPRWLAARLGLAVPEAVQAG